MKVVIAIHYFPPHMGGMENVAYEQAKRLSKKGHQVTVITSAVGGSYSANHSDFKVIRIKAWNYLESSLGVPFPIFSPTLIWHMYKAVKDCDVVHAHDSFYLTSLVAAIWAKILKMPLIVTQHVDMVPHPLGIINYIQKLVYKTTGKFILHSSQSVIILNSRVRDFLIDNRIESKKIIFMPNGVDTNLFKPSSDVSKASLREKYNLPNRVTIALFVGRFVPKKGFTKLLTVNAQKCHIAFAGGSAPEKYADNEKFTFLGPLSPSALSEVYNAVDIFILPSEGEGFPLTAQEAMASGLPVVMTHNHGYDIYEFDSTNIMFIKSERKSIEFALSSLASSPTQRKNMSTYSLTYANNNFDWNNNIKSLEEIYNKATIK